MRLAPGGNWRRPVHVRALARRQSAKLASLGRIPRYDLSRGLSRPLGQCFRSSVFFAFCPAQIFALSASRSLAWLCNQGRGANSIRGDNCDSICRRTARATRLAAHSSPSARRTKLSRELSDRARHSVPRDLKVKTVDLNCGFPTSPAGGWRRAPSAAQTCFAPIHRGSGLRPRFWPRSESSFPRIARIGVGDASHRSSFSAKRRQYYTSVSIRSTDRIQRLFSATGFPRGPSDRARDIAAHAAR